MRSPLHRRHHVLTRREHPDHGHARKYQTCRAPSSNNSRKALLDGLLLSSCLHPSPQASRAIGRGQLISSRCDGCCLAVLVVFSLRLYPCWRRLNFSCRKKKLLPLCLTQELIMFDTTAINDRLTEYVDSTICLVPPGYAASSP